MGFFVAAFYVNYKEIQGKTAMNKETLQKILETCNFGKINKELKRLGYKRTDKDKELKKASIMDVLYSENEEADDVETPEHCFCGTIYRNVKGYDGVEWIWIEQLKAYKYCYYPERLVVFAKKTIPGI